MKILFRDVIQDSDAPDSLKSPSLADKLTDSSFTITFPTPQTINCFGIGNTDAYRIVINGQIIEFAGASDVDRYKNGLYMIPVPITGTTLTISHNGTYIGRLAVGEYVELGSSPSREPGFWNTAVPRKTLSGQIIEGAGGIVGRTISVDTRYKIDSDAFEQIELGMNNEMGRGFPLFVEFGKEYNSGNGRFPWERLYATVSIKPVLQSSVNKFLYSKKFKFEEAF